MKNIDVNKIEELRTKHGVFSDELKDYILSNIREHDAFKHYPERKLLYVTYFGSHLYGLHNEQSDIDIKGIFLPSSEDIYTGKVPNTINFKTNSGKDNKNGRNDIDFEVYSINYYLNKLLPSGDTNAVDLLFSLTSPDTIIYYNTEVGNTFENVLTYHNDRHALVSRKVKSYTSYCKHQAAKYSMKGYRLNTLESIKIYLDEVKKTWSLTGFETEPVHTIYKTLLSLDTRITHIPELVNGQPADDIMRSFLEINGKKHQLSITLKEFYTRIMAEIGTYGNRAKAARNAQGTDYKALSHAMRVIVEVKQLFSEGKITFPIADEDDRKFILDIKQGAVDKETISNAIDGGLAAVETMEPYVTILPEKVNTKHYTKLLCSFIKEHLYYCNLKE